MMPGVVLRPGQIVTTAMGQRYLVLLKQGNNWLCENEGMVVERTSGFLRSHGIRLEWKCNETTATQSPGKSSESSSSTAPTRRFSSKLDLVEVVVASRA